MTSDNTLFDGFQINTMRIEEIDIHFRIGGSGPALLLLHGCPQTHVMWHKIAPTLARDFTVVVPDLRGYGDSSKPAGLPDHSNYAFRAMAEDQYQLMSRLGFASYAAVGHDRGARVLHRMALDRPAALKKLCILDILPTRHMYAQTDKNFATNYWEWFFFLQGQGLPETLLSANPKAFLRYEIGDLRDAGIVTPAAWSEYLRVLSVPGAMHGMCEDYRAGASIDLVHDEADAGKRIESPLLVLWGERNPVWSKFDMLAVWKTYARDVRGHAMPSGHYVAEEAPERLLSALSSFLGDQAGVRPETA
ncbi:MAG TPA: alpha/beta hydrolase [Sphingobium sp.]